MGRWMYMPCCRENKKWMDVVATDECLIKRIDLWADIGGCMDGWMLIQYLTDYK